MAAQRSASGLHVSLFGVPRIVLDGNPVVLKAPPRTLPLLMSLLLERRTAADGRSRLATRLWPDAGLSDARKNLRRHLSYLRKALERIGVDAPGLGDLVIGDDVVTWTDIGAFDELARTSAGAASAAELYTGSLLSPYDDEEWLAQHRSRYQRDFVDLILRLVESEWMAGRPSEALARAERALAIEPFAEELVQAALRLSIEIDDGSGGLAIFDRFSAAMRAQFDEEPEKETIGLVDRLRRRTPFVALPVAVDSFVGRAGEIARLSRQLANRHCIGLYGPPGIGKSRLAATLAAEEAARFLDGVWWVHVGRLDDGRSVEAQALRALATKGAPVGTSLAERVAGRSTLLVFDECEQVSDEVAGLVNALLSTSPGVRVIVTSTKRVPISGSLEWTVEPLHSGDAVALFVERAASVMPRVVFDVEERATIASICAALDGIPLAIELAAGRVRSRSLATILDEAVRSADPVLDGSLARSVHVLSGDAREAFVRLGIFRGEFTSQTMAGVCGVDEVRASGLLDELAASNVISLVSLEDAPRYDMLNTIRAFALRALDETERKRLSARHAEFFAERIIALNDRLRGAHAFDSYALVENDYSNVVAALEYSLDESATVERGARVCLALSRFWYDRGYLADGLRFTALAIERMPRDATTRLLNAELSWVLSWLRRNNGDFHQSYRECRASLDELVAANAPERRLAFCELLVANAARMIGKYEEAAQRGQVGVRMFDGLGETYFAGYARLICGITELCAGNVVLARQHLVEALRAYEETGAKADASLALLNLVECAYALEEMDLAEAMASEAAERCVESGNLYFLAYANHSLARVQVWRRDWSAGIRTSMTVARSAREFGDRELVALGAELAARISRYARRYTTAAILLGAAAAERERAGAARPKIYDRELEVLWSEISTKLGTDAAEHARSVGAALSGRDLPGRVEASLREAARALASRERPLGAATPAARG